MNPTNKHKNDTNSTFIPLASVTASTYRDDHFVIDMATTVTGSISPLETILDEVKWDETFKQPHVLRGLRALAVEALQDFATGETEEGGFAVE